MTSSTPEYQYHLKDHLGNVRMTFTTKDEVDESKATVENENTTSETSQFLNYNKAKRVNHAVFDHTYDNTTPPNGTTYAIRLNGSVNERIGLAKSLSVMPGDVLKLEVYAKYYEPPVGPAMGAFATLMAAILGNTASPGVVVDGSGYTTNFATTVPGPGLAGKSSETGTPPKAYLNWLVFDRNYNLVESKSGYKRITTAAKEDSTNVPHERIAPNSDVVIDQAGYAYIYLSNENESPVEVYFDDFKVEQIKSSVISSQDYFPFGLSFNSYSRENSADNKFKFNGKEEQKELGLGWYDYGARMYMPEIGRWPRIDPKAELYFQITPYAYAANTPTNAIDPDGRLVIFINGQHSGTGGTAAYWQQKEYVTRWNSYSFLGQTVWSGNETRLEVTRDFASDVQDHFNDHSPARFYDGALGGWANTLQDQTAMPLNGPIENNLSGSDRYGAGLKQGSQDAAAIIQSLARTGGVITESLKVVSHSMGGAYAKGFVQAIVDYAMAHPEECTGLKISEFDFDPLQAAQLSAIAGVHTEQYSHIKKPGRKGAMGWLANQKQAGLEDDQGMKDGNSYNEDAEKADHSIMSFFSNIQNLQEGTYVYQNGQWVKQ
jgi:RHS repeat-associated protein